jgi:rubrerythrin
MVKKVVGSKATISGKTFDEVRKNLLHRTMILKGRITQKYEDLYRRSSMDHVRYVLKELRSEEEEDTTFIKNALESGEIPIKPSTEPDMKNFEMLDHIIRDAGNETNPNDLKSVLLAAIKTTDELHNIFEIMSSEYGTSSISDLMRGLAQHEMSKKERLSELYDDMVNKDYW